MVVITTSRLEIVTEIVNNGYKVIVSSANDETYHAYPDYRIEILEEEKENVSRDYSDAWGEAND